MTTILIISTDHNPAQSLRQTLEANGFLAEVRAFNRELTPSDIQGQNPDLIMLDLYHSNGKAPEICQVVRSANAAPLVVLSTTGAPEEVAKVLDAGADDYLIKPVSNQMLFASIGKLTRRSSHNQAMLGAVNRV